MMSDCEHKWKQANDDYAIYCEKCMEVIEDDYINTLETKVKELEAKTKLAYNILNGLPLCKHDVLVKRLISILKEQGE